MNLNKLLVTVAVSTFALCAAESFAAGTMKLEELTKEQRMEMRARAEQLTADRVAGPKVKKPHAVKSKMDSRT